jgi:hypothetical protein
MPYPPNNCLIVIESSQVINCVNSMHQSLIQLTAREEFIAISRDAQIFQKSRRCLKIQGGRRVILSKFHTEDPQILGITTQNSVAWVTWCPGFVHPCLTFTTKVVIIIDKVV